MHRAQRVGLMLGLKLFAIFLTISPALGFTVPRKTLWASLKCSFDSSIPADGEFKMLPSPEMIEAAGRVPDEMKTVVVDGAPILLDKLGPVVVNIDGLLGSIGNWDELSEQQQALTMRKIGKRNQERLKALRDKNRMA